MVRAVVEGDAHSDAVRRWVDQFVIGLGFCPWAKPADEAGRIRVVTSTCTSESAVLSDLNSEALRVSGALPPACGETADGKPTTTLLVCPHVCGWDDFAPFHQFYVNQLANGYLLASHDLYVVPFHPRFGEHGPAVIVGDVIELGGGPAGASVRATVVDAMAGFGEMGQQLAKVEVDGGGEHFISLPAEGDPLANITSRAPRPTLHLLRIDDLERADDPNLRERNQQRTRALGIAGAEALLRRCG